MNILKEVMRMKKTFLLGLLLVFGCVILSYSAANATILPYWHLMIENEMGITNHESLAGDDGDGFLEIGERLRGTMRVDHISGYTSNYWVDFSGNVSTTADDGTEIAGIFDITVGDMKLFSLGPDGNPGTGDDVYNFNFVPTGNLGGYLPSGTDASIISDTALILFIDDVINDGTRYSSSDVTQNIAGAELDATDGDLLLALGFNGQNLFPATPGSPNALTDGYWWGTGTLDPDEIDTFQNGVFLNGLNALINQSGIPELLDVNDPNESWYNLNVDFFANGDLEAAGNGPYAVQSDDPVHFEPVPEPATMLLLGSGLIGLAGFGRKKRFFKKD